MRTDKIGPNLIKESAQAVAWYSTKARQEKEVEVEYSILEIKKSILLKAKEIEV